MAYFPFKDLNNKTKLNKKKMLMTLTAAECEMNFSPSFTSPLVNAGVSENTPSYPQDCLVLKLDF